MKKITKNMNRVLGRTGFTLVELLVVMAILAILIAVAIGGVGIAQRGARDNTRLRDLTAVKSALEDYYGAKKQYPPNAAALAYTAGGPVGVGSITITGTTSTVPIQQSGFQGVATPSADPTSTTCPGITTDTSSGNWSIGYKLQSGNSSKYFLCIVQENGSVVNQSSL